MEKNKLDKEETKKHIDNNFSREEIIETLQKYSSELVAYYLNSNTVKITFKENQNNIIIFINFLKNTNLNPFRVNVIFQITIDSDEYPNYPPIVKCLTNV